MHTGLPAYPLARQRLAVRLLVRPWHTSGSGRGGSDPPVRGPGTGSESGVFAHPCPRPLGVAPDQLSLRGKAVSAPLRDGGTPGHPRPHLQALGHRRATPGRARPGSPMAFPQGIADPERPPSEGGMEVHIPTLADATPGIERGGSLRSRPQVPARHGRSAAGAATARRPMTCGIGSVHIRTALLCTWTPISHVHSRPAPDLAGSGSGNGRPSRSSASPRTTSKSWFGTRRFESSSAPEQRPGPGSSTGGTGARGIARLARMPFPREVSGA